MSLTVTALYGSILGLLFAAMSLFIGLSRAGSGVMHGPVKKEGKEDTLFTSRTRAQQNFAEFVPLALILLALLETSGASGTLLNGLGLALVAFRFSHATKLFFPNEAPLLFRLVGFLGTIGWLVLVSVLLLSKSLAA